MGRPSVRAGGAVRQDIPGKSAYIREGCYVMLYTYRYNVLHFISFMCKERMHRMVWKLSVIL